MAGGSAAAALLAAALPKPSGDGNQNQRGRGATTARQNLRGGLGRASRNSRGTGVHDDDIGMNDAATEGTAQAGRKGRQARSGPMGQRPARGRNIPGNLSDRISGRAPAGSSSAASKAKATDPPASSTIDTLRLFLLNRYSQPDRMLNMENMADDPILKEHKLLAPGQPGAPSNMAGAIWKLSKEMFPDVVSLSLANNDLTSLLPLSPHLLTSSLPNIENVSFAQNRLAHFGALDPFSPLIGRRKEKKPKGWSKLKELVMKGNPMCHSTGNEEVYQREMARRFATLRTLDQMPLDPSIAFQASAARDAGISDTPGLSSKARSEKAKAREVVVFPLQIKDGFFESDGARDFVGGFLAKFFAAFDSDRPSLLPAYAPICSFSFHADTAHPVRARSKKIGINGDKRFPHQHKLDWKQYLTSEGSRNLMRVRQEAKRVATLQVSPESVISSIMALPKTEHPLSDPAKFVWDSWTMPNLLAPPAPGQEGETVIYAAVHGEFTEFPSKGIRSFSRTFILAPAPPTSAAAIAGWPCIILSDLFTIRGYSNLDFSKPRPPPQPKVPKPLAVTSASGDIPPVVNPAQPAEERAEGITDQQQSLIHQLQSVTNLTYPYAHLCMSQNGWDPNVALNQFKSLFTAGQIPAEGFIEGRMPVA
ncbi:Mex67p [Sporobolomyces koalae]|uniref:Mex67p n=1 Tax=Sporobolomyces koalae TaxID=500713 RepID=UPI0031705992